jgi:hypothetical protein
MNLADWSKSGHAPSGYLESNQDQSGFFKYQSDSVEDSFSATTTAYTVIALSGKTLPLSIFSANSTAFTLTYTAGANGSLTGSASQTVNSGADGTAVIAVPATGFHFTSWSDGVLTASRTDINITADISVTASFAIDSTSGGGGGGGNFSAPSPAPVPTPVPTTPVGQVLGAITFAQGTLVKTTDSATVYMVVDGKLRPFNAEAIFKARGLKFSNIQIIGSDLVTADNLGRVVGYPDGTLIKGSSKTVYKVFGDTKLGITSMAEFNRIKLSLKNIVKVSDADLANYDDGGIAQ